MSEYILDEKGKIADGDPIYSDLDRWYDEGSYDKIAAAVLAVPCENRSNELDFRLISAYNNLKEYGKALAELTRLRPACESRRDLARFYYLSGYIYFMTDKEMLALSLYKLGLEQDPHNELGLDLEKECRECLSYIDEDLEGFHDACLFVSAQIGDRCAENPTKIDAGEPDFILQLCYLFSRRVLPGMERGLGIDDFFKKYEGAELEAVRRYFTERLGVTDRASLLEFIQRDRYCSLSVMANDALAALRGRPTFDEDILDEAGKEAFNNTKFFVRTFAEFLPRSGVLAWDIDEKMGLARCAFSCGILENDEYVGVMTGLAELAKEKFASAAEYLRSLVFGCALYMFDSDCWNINGASSFMKKMLELLLESDLPDMEWKSPEKR